MFFICTLLGYTQQMEIKPALLESSLVDIEEKLEIIKGKLALIQIDMCDGVFVPTTTFGHAASEDSIVEIFSLLSKAQVRAEFDLMISFKDNKLFFERWIGVIQTYKPKRVIFHFSSIVFHALWKELFEKIDERSTDIYLAVSLHDELDEIQELFETYNFKGIQVMGINKVGFSGEKLDAKTFFLLRELQKTTKNLMVDGGVKITNAQELYQSGAISVATNSELFNAQDINQVILDFKNIS